MPETGAPWALREYALLADGERGALIGPRGDIQWMCAPRRHSDAVFSRLMGGPGRFTVTPEDPWNVWGGSYEDGTLIRSTSSGKPWTCWRPPRTTTGGLGRHTGGGDGGTGRRGELAPAGQRHLGTGEGLVDPRPAVRRQWGWGG